MLFGADKRVVALMGSGCQFALFITANGGFALIGNKGSSLLLSWRLQPSKLSSNGQSAERLSHCMLAHSRYSISISPLSSITLCLAEGSGVLL